MELVTEQNWCPRCHSNVKEKEVSDFLGIAVCRFECGSVYIMKPEVQECASCPTESKKRCSSCGCVLDESGNCPRC